MCVLLARQASEAEAEAEAAAQLGCVNADDFVDVEPRATATPRATAGCPDKTGAGGAWLGASPPLHESYIPQPPSVPAAPLTHRPAAEVAGLLPAGCPVAAGGALRLRLGKLRWLFYPGEYRGAGAGRGVAELLAVELGPVELLHAAFAPAGPAALAWWAQLTVADAAVLDRLPPERSRVSTLLQVRQPSLAWMPRLLRHLRVS